MRGGHRLGEPALFVIVYASVASALYFTLGEVAGRALGLTPVVFLLAGVLFGLSAMTYVEGAALHPERAGATVFARYAFNELVSFVAGWVLLLDYCLIVAAASLSAVHYLEPLWGAAADDGAVELGLTLAVVALVAALNVRGPSARRIPRIGALVGVDLVLQAALIVVGLVVLLDVGAITEPIDLGTAPGWTDLAFAAGVAMVVFTGLESAAGLSSEVRATPAGLRRLVTSSTATVVVVYAGIALVAMSALPATGGRTALGDEALEAPVLGVTRELEPPWLADLLTNAFAVVGALTLVAAAGSAMLGLSRLGYSLSRNRQIPSTLGKLHPTRATPFVLITIAAVGAGALGATGDLDLLLGVLAFGALLALTIAHVSIVVLRFREPDRERPYRVPGNVRLRGRPVPLPAVAGAALSGLLWLSVVATHEGARTVGGLWLLGGLVLYVVYRRTQGKPLLRRVVVPEAALKAERPPRAEFGSILVPVFGTPLDVDIVQTAGRLAADEDPDAFEDDHGATIEAIWVFEVPMSLPLDAALPEAQVAAARAALRRAKAVGEEYDGVEVATATVRARAAGAAIVEEARRRGVQVVVMAAEPPTKVRGGALLGGRAGSRADFLGDVTRYVAAKAPCQVIITAPPADDVPVAAPA
jgi:basic amino acid/polyamine antiporter, APA family